MVTKTKEAIVQTKESTARPPVVVLLGHVDHGKTSILDFIRKTHIAQKESGGITQHIGAYQIVKNGKKITFIDTPGHEAFSAMRARGAKVADIGLLVVDASQKVQSQTKEAISVIKSAKIPPIVVLNKIDKPEAEPERVKRELAKEGVLTESLGGDVPAVEVSAKTGQGIEDLLEIISLVAEMKGLRADAKKPAEGVVIESYLDSRRGPTATLIVNQGTLRKGDIVGTPSACGKIKALENFQGQSVNEAVPSDPVLAIGFGSVPMIGEKFRTFANIEEAQDNLCQSQGKPTSSPLKIKPEQKVLNLLLKLDTLGSREAVEQVLKDLPQEKVVLRILKSGIGQINESDIKFAKAHPVGGHPAVILGFRTRLRSGIENFAEKERVKIITSDVIYELVKNVRNFMERILKPEMVRTDLGKVKILATFLTNKKRQIVGGKVIWGEVRRGTKIDVLRNEELIGKGKLINLQRDKKDTGKVMKGQECGILFEGNVKIENGDILVFYTEQWEKGSL